MLLTVTANPSIDRVLRVPRLQIGQVHRALSMHLVAAGKGLNAARAATRLGIPTIATGILGGRHGQMVAEIFEADGCAGNWYWLARGETRVCTMLNQESGDTTVINEPGPPITEADWAGFEQHVRRLAAPMRAVALCGSALPGVRPEAPAELARTLATGGQAIYFDVGYQYLPPLLANPAGVGVKVNRDELALGLGLSWAGDALEPVVEAARLVLSRGAPLVVITLGSRGALAVTAAEVWQAAPPPVELVSSVGSGDALLAGLVAARLQGLPVPLALAQGVAAGAANAVGNLPGHMQPADFAAILDQVTVTQL